MDRERIEADVQKARLFESLVSARDMADHCEQLLAALAEAEAEVERLRGQLDWEKVEHDKARDEWLDMRDRLNGLYRRCESALEHTRPPDDAALPIIPYGGEIEAEPYAWLATLIAEGLDEFKPFRYDDWEPPRDEGLDRFIRLEQARQALASRPGEKTDCERCHGDGVITVGGTSVNPHTSALGPDPQAADDVTCPDCLGTGVETAS